MRARSAGSVGQREAGATGRVGVGGGWVDRTGATGGLTVAPRDVNRGCRLVLQTSSASEAPRFVCCSIFTVPKVSGVRLTDGLHYRSFHKNAIL